MCDKEKGTDILNGNYKAYKSRIGIVARRQRPSIDYLFLFNKPRNTEKIFNVNRIAFKNPYYNICHHADKATAL